MKTVWKWVKNFGLLGLWLMFVYLMLKDYAYDPYDPNRLGTSAYGHNAENSLRVVLPLSAIELVVLYLILQPWSYRRSWWRALMAFALAAPWTLLCMMASMHAGGVVMLNWMWLFVVDVILLVVTIVSLITWSIKRRTG